MFTKKHRESLRGLSHQDKVKKLQKLTRVPLQNLKTNIIQSDLQQDDIEIPISLKFIQTEQVLKENSQSLQRQQKFVKESKKKQQYDQQKINRTIRAMTKELYSLEKQKQKEKQQSTKNDKHQPPQTNISSFTIQEIDLELEKLSKTQHSINLAEPIRHKRHQSSFNHCQSTQLTEITLNKFHRQNNNNKIKKPQLTRRRELPTQRQTQPLYLDQVPVYQSLKTIQKLPIPQNYTNKGQSSQSNLTKRFSRTKRNTDLLGVDNLQDKKLKFNRSSNQKSKLIPNPNPSANNKENIQNFQQPKKTLLTERLSYQQIPTYLSVQTVGLRKRKNIGKFFITNNNQRSFHQNVDTENYLFTKINLQQKYNKVSSKSSPRIKQKIREQIDIFQKLSQKDIFKQLQKSRNLSNQISLNDKELLKNVIKNYRQSVELLKVFL